MNNISKFYIFISLLVGYSLHASETAKKDGKNELIHDSLEFIIHELQKSVEIKIKYSKLENAPKWNGNDYSSLPVSMPRAVAKAKDCLKKLGCNSDQYFLQECQLVRVDRNIDDQKWYWKVILTHNVGNSVDPIVIIPVLMSGEIPDLIIKDVKKE
jgi:hypothetical protein